MPALGGRQPVGYSIRDHSGEMSAFRFYADEITAVSLPGFLSDMGDLTAAIAAITLGEIAKTSWGEETILSNEVPANPFAQRELALLVRMQGATSQAPFSVRIPTIDASKLTFVPGGGDAVIISGAGATAEVLALVAAIEALASNPDDEAEDAVVVEMRLVRGDK